MLKEGHGKIAPQSVTIPIEHSWVTICREAADARQKRDSKRSDDWGKGCSEDPHYIGLIAECAVSFYLGHAVDFTFGYDKGYDFKHLGLRIDVKGSRNVPLIRQQKKQKCHAFIFATVGDNSVEILGWINWSEVKKKPIVPGKGTHLNHQVQVSDLRDIAELKSRRIGVNLLRYPGGKSKLWSRLKEYMPNGELFAPQRYVEPMIGGGGITTQILRRCKFREVLLADKDYSLVRLWQAVAQDPKKLCAMVCRWVPNVDDWHRSKELDGDMSISHLESAFLKLVLHYCSHGGLGFVAGGPQGGKDQTGDYLIGCRWNLGKIVKTIQGVHRLIRGAEIRCWDFEQIELRNSDFVFVDPPYMQAGSSLYRHGFLGDHFRLRQWITSSPSEWVITYDDDHQVREWYKDYRIQKILNTSGNNSAKYELVISNFR